MMKTWIEARSSFQVLLQQLEKHNSSLESTIKESQIYSFIDLHMYARGLSTLIGFKGSDQPHLGPPTTLLPI